MADSDDRNSSTGSQNTESTDASITMKADATNEDSCKQDNTDNEKQEEDFKMCSPTNRSSMNAVTNPFASSSINKTNNILKPPQLSLNNNANNKSKSFILCPSRLSTVVKKTDDTNNSNSGSSRSSSSSSSSEKIALVNGETPKFVPLIHSSTTQSTPSSTSTTIAAATTTPTVAAAPPPPPTITTRNSTASTTSNSTKLTSSFVFGQNLRDRVIAPSTTTETDNVNNNNNNNNRIDEPEPSTSVNSNGTTEMLFSSAIKNEKRIENTTTTTATASSTNNKETKSLSETAREYEESRANKRKYEEVEVVTGEEGETNILNITCKLFAFDKGSWQERGRGVLRLNDLEADDKVVQSRLVFRCTGSFRVVLNTKIWADMTVEKASEKSVRFTALDADGEIKIYLVMASFDDARQMFTQIQNRVQKEMSVQKLKKFHTSSTATTTTTDKE